jgi:formamidopyrimidine-DNA glycosylase
VPELPEVETVVRDLQGELVGRRLASVEVGGLRLRRPWSADWEPALKGRRVRDVRRYGKWIMLELDRGLLIFHLGMTGQLRVAPAQEPRAAHTHLVIGLDRGDRQLRFRDVRRFGSATRFETAEQFFRDAGLGPDALALEQDYWRRRLAATNRTLKAVLLDQRVVAGVGNIYADESLFEARLHPARVACRLSLAEADRLRRAVVTVLKRAIPHRGTSFDGAYVGGRYREKLRVYGRSGKPCRRCGTPVRCVRLAGRSTHYCPRCQPEPAAP